MVTAFLLRKTYKEWVYKGFRGWRGLIVDDGMLLAV
jgi:hypothetical protein